MKNPKVQQSTQCNIIKVYRIADSKGNGMYCGRVTNVSKDAYDTDRHKAPESDSLLVLNMLMKGGFKLNHTEAFVVKPEYYFGFTSLKQLRKWLYKDDWFLDLYKKGYKLEIHYVPEDDVILGSTQVMFIKENARKVTRWCLLKKFNLKEPRVIKCIKCNDIGRVGKVG